jgi:hypothetical protein
VDPVRALVIVKLPSADSVGRANQPILLVPGEVPEVDQPEGAEGDERSYGVRVIARFIPHVLERAAERIRAASAFERNTEQTAADADHSHVQSRDWDLVVRLHFEMGALPAHLQIGLIWGRALAAGGSVISLPSGSPSVSPAAAAKLAWARTLEFLR